MTDRRRIELADQRRAIEAHEALITLHDHERQATHRATHELVLRLIYQEGGQ